MASSDHEFVRELMCTDTFKLKNLIDIVLEDTLFVITGMPDKFAIKRHGGDLESISKPDAITAATRFVLAKPNDFSRLSNVRKNVHEVNYYFRKLVWLQSNRGADLNILRKTAIIESILNKFAPKTNRSVTIIFADSGMGKTVTLNQIKSKIKNEDKSAVVLYVNDYSLRRFCIDFKIVNASNFIKFFDLDVNNPNIHLMFENFENMHQFKDIMNMFVDFHHNYENIKLWITCKEMQTRTILESRLGALAYYLASVSTEMQVQYLKDVWSITNDESDNYINTILDCCNTMQWKRFLLHKESRLVNTFTSYPLHLNMIGKKFSPATNAQVPTHFDITEIYEMFVATQLNDTIANLEEVAAMQMYQNTNVGVAEKDEHGFESNFEFEHTNVMEFCAAKWFSENFTGYRKQYKQILCTPTTTWLFSHFVNRLLSRGYPLHTAILNDDVKLVKIITDNVNILSKDNGSRSPLHLAESGDIIEFLVQSGAQIQLKDAVLQWTPIEYFDLNAILKGINILLEANADSSVLTATLNSSQSEVSKRFKYALSQKLYYYIKFICQNYKNLKVDSEDIKKAVSSLPQNCVMLILQRAEEYEDFQVNEFCDLALLDAVKKNYFDAVQFMAERLHADIFYETLGEYSLFRYACDAGNIEIARYLLELGLDLNSVDRWHYYNAYISCCRTNNAQVMHFLVEAGINTDIALQRGETPLQLACHNGSPAIVQYLLENARKLNIRYAMESIQWLYNAVCCPSIYFMEIILAHNQVDVNADISGTTVLHVACTNDHIDVVRMLLEAGANVNGTDNNNCTPLFFAHTSNNPDIVRCLLEAGADVAHQNSNGETALHYFAKHTSDITISSLILCIELLIRNGANVNQKSSSGNTPLHLASCPSRTVVFNYLIAHGGNLTISNNNGETPPHKQCHKCQNAVTVTT